MLMLRIAMPALLALLVAFPVLADDPCEPEERREANAIFTRAQAAEASGDLVTALRLAGSSEVRACADGDYMALVKRVTAPLGKQAEARGEIDVAFRYFSGGQWYQDAERVGLKRLAAAPRDYQLASSLLVFMGSNDLADGEAQVRQHARRQAEQLLTDESRTFTPHTPQRDLLEEAKRWYSLAGDPDTPVRDRALKRADDYLAMDYPFALEQALSHYSLAEREERHAAVQQKARTLADGLATTNDWAVAVDLYYIAGDLERGDALRAEREASAEETEAARQERFKKEQDDLEKDLGF